MKDIILKWLGLDGISVDIAGLHLDVSDNQQQIAELNAVVFKPVPEYIEKVVHSDKSRVYLSYEKGKNAKGFPIFEFYPADTAPVNERVFVESGATVRMKPDPVLGDGGKLGWPVVLPIPLMAGSADVPPVQLYVMDKFL